MKILLFIISNLQAQTIIISPGFEIFEESKNKISMIFEMESGLKRSLIFRISDLIQ